MNLEKVKRKEIDPAKMYLIYVPEKKGAYAPTYKLLTGVDLVIYLKSLIASGINDFEAYNLPQ